MHLQANVDLDRLDLVVVIQGIFTILTADTTLLVATEGSVVILIPQC